VKRLLFSLAICSTLLAFAASAAAGDRSAVGAAYSISNAASGNDLVFYTRSANGSLTPAGSVSAGGVGTGGGLASQGAVTVTENGRTVLAVNPGSNSVAAFAVETGSPRLLNTAPSGGIRPVSVAVHKQLVYVLNKNNVALASVSGFTLDKGGLSPIAGSTRVLHAGATDAAQVRFSPSGGVLVVTGRSSQRIDTFRVGADGLLSDPESFDVAPGAVSTFAVSPAGELTFERAVTIDGMTALDLALSENGHYLYLLAAGSHGIVAFEVGADGTLTHVDTESDVPLAAAGIAAR
jgi:6-phosphogluconolactonase (cycloisomerase 2 family)